MTFGEAVASCFRNYANSAGRAPRSEYWYWTLFELLVSIPGWVIDATLFPAAELLSVSTVIGVALFLPSVAVSIRRLHDIDRSGWWVLLAFTIVGIIPLIYWACLRGSPGPNRFGPDPLERREPLPSGI
jgi:uncharacterized membrane protein YhaH (DUF805 family)